MNKTFCIAALIASSAFAGDEACDELNKTFAALTLKEAYTPAISATPSPPPTPTTWDELQTTLLTAPYYTTAPGNYCYGAKSIPLFVDRLQAIEAAGIDKAVILEKQLAFITSTWSTWNIWHVYPNIFDPLRYNLVYNFLLNRSQQTTSSSFWSACCPPLGYRYFPGLSGLNAPKR